MDSTFPLTFAPSHAAPAQPAAADLLFAFKKRELLVTSEHQVLTMTDAAVFGIEPLRTQYLGQLGQIHCFSAELHDDVELPSGLLLCDLRRLFGKLEPELHAVAGRAVQIAEWDRTHQFCGACGGPTELSATDRSRRCPECQFPMYPRLAPAMIVAVEKGDQILLARSGHFPEGIYSVLAGFVEPGESAEEAVIREVWEESRIVVENVRYFGSQPWPFPNSLMLGFTAQYLSGDVDTSHDAEVEDAGWFVFDDLPPTFPGRRSISQWLLHDFVDRKRSKANQ